MTEHDVRVGDGRLLAPFPVGGRAGVGASRLRSDAQCLRQLGHVRDRPAARADGVDVDGRDLDAEMADRGLSPDRRLAVLTEGDVGRRPAHVEGEDVVEPGLAGHEQAAGDATRGAGENAVDRVSRRLPRRHQAGVGAEDVDLRLRADPGEPALQLLDVGGDLRPDVRVHARRERALVLAELGQHLRREGHGEARVEPLDDLADPGLVRTRDVRVDEPDGQRLDARFDEVADDRLDLCLVDRDDRVAAGIHPLDGLARVRQRCRRIGLDHDDPAGERARRLRARQVEDLLEALRGDQPDAGSLRLENGVRRDGRAMEDVLDLRDLDARLVADPPDAVQHALRGVRGRRRRLDTVLPAAVPVAHEEQVGERAADVHSQPVRHC